jgi:hypothetical protein
VGDTGVGPAACGAGGWAGGVPWDSGGAAAGVGVGRRICGSPAGAEPDGVGIPGDAGGTTCGSGDVAGGGVASVEAGGVCWAPANGASISVMHRPAADRVNIRRMVTMMIPPVLVIANS